MALISWTSQPMASPSGGKRRILVTGGAGFIGSHFVDLALHEDFHVSVLDALTYSGMRENLPQESSNFQFIHGNILESSLLDATINRLQPHWIVNFAAESHVDRAIASPEAFVQTNILGTFRLLESSLQYWKGLHGSMKSNFRFLQVSTDEVFGSLELKEEKFSEKSPFRPNSPYASSKASADLLVRSWNKTYQFPTINTQCSNNFGARQYPEKLIPHIIQRALSNQSLPLYGRGENIRDWIFVEEHCTGILQALRKGKPGHSYCLGGNYELKNIQIVEMICDILDRLCPKKIGETYRTQIEFVADRPGHDFRYALDASLASSELGFNPSPQLFNDRLEQTIKWYLENKDWCQRASDRVKGVLQFNWKSSEELS